jgi:HD-like signal output (HDOD) protein
MTGLRRPEPLTDPPVPARAVAAARVLAITDDPDSSMADLVRAMAADPALAAKVMKLANSAYYGLSRRVGTLQYAISVVGLLTVRALAVPVCAGLEGPDAVPPGFWDQAATAATAADLIAPLIGASSPDAFCAGLLHTLGSAMLHQQQPLPALCLPEPENEDEFNRREIAIYGIGHAEAGAKMLASWRFPEHLCALVASHHDTPLPDATPLARALRAARVVTDLCLADNPNRTRALGTLLRLSEGELTESRIDGLAEKVRLQSEALMIGLRS